MLQDCCETVCPALKMAEKVPDSHVKLWAAALLGDAIKLPGSTTALNLKQTPEVVHSNVKQQLLSDFLASSKLPEHELIQVNFCFAFFLFLRAFNVVGLLLNLKTFFSGEQSANFFMIPIHFLK